MKRVIVAACIAMLTACNTQPSHPKPKGNQFEFRNMIARHTTLDEAQSMDEFTACESQNDGSKDCQFAKTQIAGVDVTKTSANFVGGTFDYLDAQLPAFNYEPLRDALLKVYGKPCKTEAAVEAEKKEMGKIVRGREIQWCFDNGWLSLMESARHYGDEAGELEFLSNRDVTGDPTYNASTL